MAENNFTYIEKTLPRVVDKVFAKESLTDALIGGSELKLDFLDARTVKVFMLASTGLYNYARGGHGQDNTRGSAKSTTQTFTLEQERYSEIPLDRLDSLDDGETVLGHLAGEFVRTKVVQEFDAYRFSKLAGYTSLTMGNRVVETIDDNTIIAKFNKALKWLAEQKVPNEDQVIYVNPDVMQKIRNTSELEKRLRPDDMSKDVKFAIDLYESRKLIEVPSDEFFTDIVVGDGYYPSSKSKVINFMIVYKKAPVIVKKLDFAKVYDSNNGAYLGYNGYLFTNLYYHDLFVPENKRVGIYCSVSEDDATSVSSALLVDAVASSEVGKCVVNSVLTQPAGMLWDEIRVSNETTRPVIGSDSSSLESIEIGGAFTPGKEHNWIVACLDNKVVAVSKDFEGNLPVGE